MCITVDRFLCCISLKAGAIAIAVFNMCIGFGWLGYLIYLLDHDDKFVMGWCKDGMHLTYGKACRWVLWYFLAVCIVNIPMSIVLLIGTYKENRIAVGVWEVFNFVLSAMIICLLFYMGGFYSIAVSNDYALAALMVVCLLVFSSYYNAVVVHSYATKELCNEGQNVIFPAHKSPEHMFEH